MKNDYANLCKCCQMLKAVRKVQFEISARSLKTLDQFSALLQLNHLKSEVTFPKHKWVQQHFLPEVH